MFQTRITEMLGIKYPIIQGGMMWLGTSELAAAVSSAGGLGIVTAAVYPSPEELRAAIRKTKTLTDKPFGVNITAMPSFRPIDKGALVDVVIEEGVAALETAGRDTEELVERIKKGKIKWIHKCGRVRDAITAERRFGADAVITVGYECGGAPPMNEVTSLILIPLVVDSIKIPVLAGGGICDARGFVAARALGAEGVVMGTRFVASTECIAHNNIKKAMIEARETDTILVQRSIGSMERVLRNEAAEKVLAMEQKGATLEELRPFIAGENAQKGWFEGDINQGVLPLGQAVGQIQEVLSVKEIIGGIVEGAAAIHNRLAL